MKQKTDGLMMEQGDNRWIRCLPPWRVSVVCLVLDAVFFSSLLVYVQTLEQSKVLIMMPWPVTSFGVFNRVISVLGVVAVYGLVPVSFYAFFKALKIAVLRSTTPSIIPPSKGLVGLQQVMGEQIGRLWWCNLAYGVGGFVFFAFAEVMAAGIKDPYMPLIIGIVLASGFSFLVVWAMITHAQIYHKKKLPAQAALAGIRPWKALVPYAAASLLSFGVVNLVGYAVFSYIPSDGVSTMFAALGALVFLFWINVYQWQLHQNETYL